MEDQVSDPRGAKFFTPQHGTVVPKNFFIFSLFKTFLVFFSRTSLFFILGEYICEVETFGDPIHQINHLNVLGKSEYTLKYT